MSHLLYNIDCLRWLDGYIADAEWDTIFADPPDNIGLSYGQYNDSMSAEKYVELLRRWLTTFIAHAKCVWFSYNAKWWVEVGAIVTEIERHYEGEVIAKPCVQIFTFGQHNRNDLGNNHRPLLRLMWEDAPLYPKAVRVPSWRQLNGDKRANPEGRVPGDVFDFPRVVGNSHQRRKWHPTQLNEGLVERCLKLTTAEDDYVLDPFGGTGTTLRVCKQINRNCTLLEIGKNYCKNIAAEHDLRSVNPTEWESTT